MTSPSQPKMSRRFALLLPLALGGCDLLDENFFAKEKIPLPGKRLAVNELHRGLAVDNPRNLKVVLPAPTQRANWPQAGGGVSHEMGHARVADSLNEAWNASIGAGGGYRRKITAAPVVMDGRIYTMDSKALVSAFDAITGKKLWEFDTTPEDFRGTNVGGGIAVDGGLVFAATGMAEILAIDVATGKPKWRQPLDNAARSAPTVADGKLFIGLLGDSLVAHAQADGRRIWSYKASESSASVLGLPSPAYADGILVAGFGSGDLVALRGNSGAVLWLDSLAATRGRNSASDLAAIHGLPVIQDGRVYATGLGGVMLSLDLRSGRRLWERDIASDATPCVAGEWIFILSVDNQLAALNRFDGSIAWMTQLQTFENMEERKDAIRWLGPTLAADRLIVVSNKGLAVAVSPYTGDILGQQKLSAAASLAPIVAMGSVFIVTDDATLLALR